MALTNNYCVEFTGSTENVNLGSDASLDNRFDTANGGTFSAWVYLRSDGGSNTGHLFEKSTYHHFTTIGDTGTHVKLEYRRDRFGGGSNDGIWQTTSAAVPLNEWVHIQLEMNNSSTANDPVIYVNGSSVGITETSAPAGNLRSDANSDFLLGGDGSAAIDGFLDEVSIWSKTGVTGIYNAGTPDDLSTLGDYTTYCVSWYRMGDGDTYSTLTDSKGSNNGTMTNMVAGDIVNFGAPNDPVVDNFDQDSFRFRNDDGSETAATWKAAANTNITATMTPGTDYPFRLRFLVQQGAGVAGSLTNLTLQVQRNSSGTYESLATNGWVTSRASTYFADDANTTQQIGSGTFVSTNAGMDEDNGIACETGLSVPASNEVEVEYSLQINWNKVQTGDTLAFRLVDNGTALTSYTNTPTITIGYDSAVIATYASHDAFITDGAGGTNAGILETDDSPVNWSYLKFTPQGVVNVASARLRLWLESSEASSGYTVIAQEVTCDHTWDEATITGTNYTTEIGTTYGSSATAQNANTGDAGKFVEWDVSAWVDSGQTYTFRVYRNAGTGKTQFTSSEGEDTTNAQPELIITTQNQTTFTPVADAFVDASTPTTNYGTDTQLKHDGDPVVESFLRFTVSGLTGTVNGAVFRIYAESANSQGLTLYQVADNTWIESGGSSITYNTKPTIGSSLGTSGAVAANTWYDIDVSSYVTGNATYSFAFTNTAGNTTATNYTSREGTAANRPQLIVGTTSGQDITGTTLDVDQTVSTGSPAKSVTGTTLDVDQTVSTGTPAKAVTGTTLDIDQTVSTGQAAHPIVGTTLDIDQTFSHAITNLRTGNPNNLQLALQADTSDLWQTTAESTPAGIGDPVGRIDDLSANDYDADQATISLKPTVVTDAGMLGWQGDGLDDRLYSHSVASNYLTGKASFSIYVVYRLETIASSNWPDSIEVWRASSSTTSAELTVMWEWQDNIYQSCKGDAGTANSNQVSYTRDQAYHVIATISDGTNLKTYVDGTLKCSDTYDADTYTLDEFFIGTDYNSWAGDGVYRAVYVYSAAHNDTDRNTIETELYNQYVLPTLVHPSITTNMQFAIQADTSDLWQETTETTVAGVGNPVGRIDDLSANDYDADQTTAANRPTAQAGYLAFDGDDFLSSNSVSTYVTGGASFTMYMVLAATYNVQDDYLFDFSSGNNDNRIFVYTRQATGAWRLQVRSDDTYQGFDDGGSFPADDTGIVVTLKYDGSNYKFYVDGTEACSVAALTTDPTISAFNIFTDLNAGTQSLTGDLYACYLYSTAHNDTDRNTIETDLYKQYILPTLVHPSITTNLQLALQADTSDLWQETAETNTAGVGDPVGRIDDLSANDYDFDQGTAAYKPTTQSGYIAFDSTEALNGDAAASLLDGDFTMYYVVKHGTIVATSDQLFNATGTNAKLMFWRNSSADYVLRCFWQFGHASTLQNITSAVMPDTITVITIRWNTTTDTFDVYFDGSNVINATNAPAGSPTFTAWALAAQGDDGFNGSEQDFYALYVYTVAHNDTDRATIEADLTAAYIPQDVIATSLDIDQTVSTGTPSKAVTGTTLDIDQTVSTGTVTHAIVGTTLDIDATFGTATVSKAVTGTTLDVDQTVSTGTPAKSVTGTTLDVDVSVQTGTPSTTTMGTTLDIDTTVSTGNPAKAVTGTTLDVDQTVSTGTPSKAVTGTSLDVDQTVSTGTATHAIVGTTLDIDTSFGTATVSKAVTGTTLDIDQTVSTGTIGGAIIATPLDIDVTVSTGTPSKAVTATSLDVDLTFGTATVTKNIVATSLVVEATYPTTTVNKSVTGTTLDVDLTVSNGIVSQGTGVIGTTLDVDLTFGTAVVTKNVLATTLDIDTTVSTGTVGSYQNITGTTLDIDFTFGTTTVTKDVQADTLDIDTTYPATIVTKSVTGSTLSQLLGFGTATPAKNVPATPVDIDASFGTPTIVKAVAGLAVAQQVNVYAGYVGLFELNYYDAALIAQLKYTVATSALAKYSVAITADTLYDITTEVN